MDTEIRGKAQFRAIAKYPSGKQGGNAERFGTWAFGAIPRQDDIGTLAALAMAPVVPASEEAAADAVLPGSTAQ